ncbi:uncharacterized protein STEHIDRAFT_78833 [Stereum hirsutum FP-91666 SS1]|uniref:uncharacterized protein n=1 Tax=Stereum hirsutum (strain FP-91666) TaxID=721885 RepID=UPI000440A238|nr:uncharacterized protein STEHIDRAFT_78833 [Stereum hirsutum FP-91666 SS1]EIM86351.1 hypothetical protein STEHIDRAFT_78833 [Stereum hirsutum FP-91666 SS1]
MAHPEAKLPPTYQAYRLREAKMVPGKEDVGEQGVSVREKFFFPERRVWGLGWGNAVQELLLNALLAWKSGRTFVWDDYLWHYKDTLHFSLYNNKLIPSRVPLSALISGSILGEIYPGQRPLFPRFKSVPRSYFESQRVCGGRVHRINNEEITEAVYKEGGIKDVSAGRFLEGWAERLRGVEEECVSNGGSAGQIFDFWIWGGRNIYDLWPILHKSPVLTGFGSSPLVLLAFEANKHLLDLPPSPFIAPFLPKLQVPAPPPTQPHDPSSLSSSNPSSDLSLSLSTPHPPISYIPNAFPSSYLASARLSEYTPIPGLLVLHIRRGDFEEHCRNLAGWGVLWQGFNMMVQEGMRDGLGVLWSESGAEGMEGNSMVGLDHGAVQEEEEAAARIKAESELSPSADVNEEDDMEETVRNGNAARAGGPFQSPKGRPGSNQVPSSSTGKTRSYTGPMLGSPPPLLSHPDREANYLSRCYPSISGIVQRVREVRWEYPRLRRVYVMTNGPGEWVGELKKELMRDSEGHEGVFGEMDREERRRLREKEGKSRDGDEEEEEEEERERESVGPWEAVFSSRDLVLDWEQKYVAQSVDMAIGARADVLIGNGWSSLTAHIVMLRMGHDVENERNRFW